MAIIYSYPLVASLQNPDLFIISRTPEDPDEISNFSVTTDTLASFVTARVNLNFLGDTGTGIVNLDTQNLTISGTTNEIETSATAQTLQIGLPDNVTITNNLTVGGAGNFTGQVTIPLDPIADTDAASKGYVDTAVTGLLDFKGTFKADTGEILSGSNAGSYLYNCPGGAGARVAISVGDYYIVANAGGNFYCSGDLLNIGDSIFAVADAAVNSSTINDWGIVESDNIEGSGTANKLPIWTDSQVLADSLITQEATGVGTIFDFNAIKNGNLYTPSINTKLLDVNSSGVQKISITQDGGGGVVLPNNGGITNPGPSFNLGGQAFANGENAISVGAATTAFGSGSLAANFITLASGGGASAFGLLTEAAGLASASFGNKSKATGAYSIASGQDSIASGQSAVAIGEKGDANGKNSFVQGFGGTAAGNNSAKFGYAGSAGGNNAVKFGFESIASGNASFASGWQTTASGLYSFTAGDGNTASGERTVAFGLDNNVSGKGSFAIGATNVIAGENSFAGGKNNNLTAASAGEAGAQTSFVFGDSNTLKESDCIILGSSNTIDVGAGNGANNKIIGNSNSIGGTTNQSAIIGNFNTNTAYDNIVAIGRSLDLLNDTIIDINTDVAIGFGGSGSQVRFKNVAITDRQLRIGKADDVGPTASNTTGFINFNDSVYGNSAFVNVGGIVGYFPPPTDVNAYDFFNAFSENINSSVFQTGANPTSGRLSIKMDPQFGTNDIGGRGHVVYHRLDANVSAGMVEYKTANQNYDYATGAQNSPGDQGIFTFDARYQGFDYTAPAGTVLFLIKSGYGQKKFSITQAGGGGNTNPGPSLNFGKGALATGQDAAAMGNSVTASANSSFATGKNNTASATESFVAGINSSVGSIYSAAFGDSNTITSSSFSSFVAGTGNNTNSKPKSIVLGQGLISRDENAITLGRFNSVPVQNSIFVLGNGTSSGSTSNAIEVTKAASHIVLPALQASASYADDTAAGLGGVPIGGLYRNGNVVQIRLA